MISGYQECPDRDPRPTRWDIVLDLALLTLLGIVLACGAV